MTDKQITICGHGSGRPSTKNLNTYSTSRYSQKASNGVRKGIVCVRRFRELNTDKERKQFHDEYKRLLGRNYYSQVRRSYVYKAYSDGKFYSDCSSSGMAALQECGFEVPLLNTAGIYRSQLFIDVPVVIKNGHIQNPEILRVSDAILFAGSDPSRPRQIGHVEFVYEIDQAEKYSGTFPILPAKGYLERGDKGTQVKRLQAFLNWYGAFGLAKDGVFGILTENALKHFQREQALAVDGVFGKKSLAKAKTIKK